MTSFDEREKAFEREFAHREELAFKTRERGLKSLALWAAQRLGKVGKAGEAYALDVVTSDIAGPTPGTGPQRVVADLRASGIAGQEVDEAMNRFLAEAAIRGPLGSDDRPGAQHND